MTSRDALTGRPSLWRPVCSALLLAAVAGTAFLLWRLVAAACPECLTLQGWRAWHDPLLDFVRSNPLVATVVLFVLHVLLEVLALPGASLLMLVAGAGLGPLAGTLLCLTACTAGTSLSMLAVRHFLQPVLRRKMGARLAAIETVGDIYSPRVLLSLAALGLLPWALKLGHRAWQSRVGAVV